MNDIELKNIWKTYDQKIEEAKILNLQSWAVNIKTFEYLQTHKAATILGSLSRYKKVAVILGLLWAFFLGILVYGNHFKNVYFTVSVLAIFIFTIIAIAAYVKQIILIGRINYGNSLTDTQEKLTRLKASTIKSIRVIWLQLPFYTTFFWNTEWMKSDIKFWLITFPVTLIFTFFAIWLYKNISLKNAEKKWLKMLLGNKEWTSLINAKKYLDEIEEFKQG